MLMTLPQTVTHKRLAPDDEIRSSDSPIYYVAWRSGRSHPWRSEEFTCRFHAHSRYFALLDRGAEAYVEKRQPAAF